MDQKSKAKELETEVKAVALAQTEQDLANAVIMIQERDAKISSLEQVVPPSPKITIPNLALTADDADNTDTPNDATTAGFGTRFPLNPKKGDMFLRVDTLPNRLYKWNGKKWIEIDKTTTDRYAYEEEYIQYLLDKIRSREYAFDDLSQIEKDQIPANLRSPKKSHRDKFHCRCFSRDTSAIFF